MVALTLRHMTDTEPFETFRFGGVLRACNYARRVCGVMTWKYENLALIQQRDGIEYIIREVS